MSIKLIAFDLDGTFLYDDKTVPDENMRVLKSAAERGVHIVPATGRVLSVLPDELMALPELRYMIGANGALVSDIQEDKEIYSAKIPLERALEVYAYADSQGLSYDCYLDNHGYMSAHMYDTIQDIVTIPGILKLLKSKRIQVDSLTDYLRERNDALQKIQFYVSDPEKKARITAELREKFPDLCTTSSLPMNIEINGGRASKGQALCALCKYLGIDIKDTIALGDGSNDLDMIKAAGTGVAMANAVDELKAAADFVTLSNMECGFARALEKFM